MSSFYRRYRGYRPRFGYRRGYNRYWRRRGWYRRGVSRAQSTGERRFKLVVPLNYTFSFTLAEGSTVSTVLGTNPYSEGAGGDPLRCMCSLPSSEVYRTYARLYDEVKIDWASLNLSCMENIGSNIPAVSVITGLDRCCTAAEAAAAAGGEWPTFAQLVGSGTSERFMMNSLTKKSVRRFIRASDLTERTLFHDCSLVTVTAGGVSVTADNAYYHMGAAAHACLFFAPSFQFAIELPAAAPAGGFSVTFQMEIKYGVTFRNPKYGMIAQNAKSGVEAVKSEGAGKSVAKSVHFDAGAVSDVLPIFSGLLGDVVDRLSANMREDGIYEDGDYSQSEDLKFAYEKLGDEKFHELFKDVYEVSLKKIGLISDGSESIVPKEA